NRYISITHIVNGWIPCHNFNIDLGLLKLHRYENQLTTNQQLSLAFSSTILIVRKKGKVHNIGVRIPLFKGETFTSQR
ncbi:MAG: hypothetical protein ACE5PO_08405, partial [Candidatus Bathyarchaeia archaeon]